MQEVIPEKTKRVTNKEKKSPTPCKKALAMHTQSQDQFTVKKTASPKLHMAELHNEDEDSEGNAVTKESARLETHHPQHIEMPTNRSLFE